MPTIPITFNQGIQGPAKLGTAIVKPASPGRMSYAQNVDIHNDENGEGMITPGPALVTITNNSTLAGVPLAKAAFSNSSSNKGWIYLAGGTIGSANKIYRVDDVENGGTPSIDSVNTQTVTHDTHAAPQLTDMVVRANSASNIGLYVVGYDDTDSLLWIGQADDTTIAVNATGTLTPYGTGFVPHIIVGQDANVYIGHGRDIDKVDTSDTISSDVLDLQFDYTITELAAWQHRLLIAYSTEQTATFTQRKAGGRSGLILWDCISSSFDKDIFCPSRYISAVVNDPDGSLLVFGGVDGGKSTIYNFNGYGFEPLYTYIGDLPRSRHGVEFDGQGRVLWITADGQICRYDKRTRVFDHIGTITTGSSAGGVLTRLVGGTGNEFLATSGTGSTYTCKRITFGTFTGDAAAVTDDTSTPLAIGGQIAIPPRSMLNYVDVRLSKSLASGEKVEVRLYKDGSTTYSVLGSLSFATDGAIAGKKIHLRKYGLDNLTIGVAWKQADALATSPGVLGIIADYSQLR